ncbi:hypothetical protein UVI_02044100 [Ustilaginoidea virens]|nr:hypothetical protein UVI_02044100 [Ustilaginoidea virens]
MFANATERGLYEKAAADFRLPYWDWSLKAPASETFLPDVFWSPFILQSGPNGVQNIRNPLYSYQFHPLDKEALIWNPLKQWNETKRAPETAVSMTAPPSNNDEANTALLSKLPEIQQRLYVLFSSYRDYNSFSNKAWAASQGLSQLDSIESVHDVIHIYGGSKGHLTYVPLSSFDPLFLLHHTMTDRLIAMWQVLNPSAWITPMPAGETSFTAVKGTVQSSASPLTPFYAGEDGTFWTSDMARSTDAFGYGYADTIAPPGYDEDVRQDLIRKINNWYGSASPRGLMSGAAGRLGKGSEPWTRPTSSGPSHYVEWIANVRVNVEALDGSYVVHFFLGEPPPPPPPPPPMATTTTTRAGWTLARNLVGSVAIFAMDRSTGSRSQISGSVPLTSAIMGVVSAGEVADLSPQSVGPYLASKLRFAVQRSNGSEANPAHVDGLRIHVTTSNVRIPGGETELPEWGAPVTRLELFHSS